MRSDNEGHEGPPAAGPGSALTGEHLRRGLALRVDLLGRLVMTLPPVVRGTRRLLVLVDSDQGLTAREASLWESLVARIRAGKLDRDLARGVSPDATPPLALRAHALVQPKVQRELACRVVRVLAEGTGLAPRATGSRIPIRRDSVQASADQFRALIDRLRTPGPLPVRGIAQVRNLLTDGAGPLYHPGCDDELLGAVEKALAALEPLGAR